MERFPDPQAGGYVETFSVILPKTNVERFPDHAIACRDMWKDYLIPQWEIGGDFSCSASWIGHFRQFRKSEMPISKLLRMINQHSGHLCGVIFCYLGKFYLSTMKNNRERQKWSSMVYVEWFPVKRVMIQDVKKRILSRSEINMWRFFLITLFGSFANSLKLNE